MNKTERLYAIAEELRRAGRYGTSGPQLAARLEVSARTVKRDIAALQQAGLTIWAESGPGGGYVLDESASLPPVNFTPGQAVAVAVALAALPEGSPFAVDARTARDKLWDALSGADRQRAEHLAARVWVRHEVDGGASVASGPHPGSGSAGRDGTGRPSGAASEPARRRSLRAVEQALSGTRVLALTYVGRAGARTERRVEPVILASAGGHWYLVAWCRLREAVRWFRLDRIESAHLTTGTYCPRPVAEIGEPPPGAASVG